MSDQHARVSDVGGAATFYERPPDWNSIVSSEEWGAAEPEARLYRLADQSQHMARWLVQSGMDRQKATERSQKFFEAWRLHALDNGVAPGTHATNELLTSLNDTVFGAMGGQGITLSLPHQSALEEEDIPEEQRDRLWKEYISTPEDKRESVAARLRDVHGIIVEDFGDGEGFVRRADLNDRVTFDPMALLGYATRAVAGRAKAAGRDKVESMFADNPALAQTFLFGDVPRAFGSAAGFVAAGAAGGTPAVAGTGIGVMAESAYFTAKESGADPDQVEQQVGIQSLIGATEVFGLGGRINILRHTPFGRAVETGIGRYIFGGFKEGAQETLQQALTDVSEKYGEIDPDRRILDPAQTARAFGAAFITGAALTGLEHSDAVVMAKAQKALNEITLDTAGSVINGSHPAVQRLESVRRSRESTPGQKEAAKISIEGFQRNAAELIQGARASNADLRTSVAGDEIRALDPAPKTKRSEAPEAFGNLPVVEAIAKHGGLLSRSRAPKEADQALWDDAPRFQNPAHNSALYKGDGLQPDQMAQLLHEDGVIEEPSTNAMWQALGEASQSATRIREQAEQEENRQAAGEEQALAFGDDAFTFQPGEQEIQVNELGVGDEITLNGQAVRVTAVDETGVVTLDGGERYGLQRVEDGQQIWAESLKVSDGREAQDVDTPFRLAGQGRAADVIPIDPIRGEGTLKTREILFSASRTIGVNVKYRGTGAGAIGTYFPGNASATVRYDGDLPTAGHEIAHALDDAYGLVAPWSAPRQRSPFDAEIMPLGQPGFTASQWRGMSLRQRRAEAAAEWIRYWLGNPDAAARRAPDFHDHFVQTVPADVRRGLREFGDDIRRFAGSPASEQALANVETEPETKLQKIMRVITGRNLRSGFNLSAGDYFAREFTDRLQPFVAGVDFATAAAGIDSLLPSDDPVGLARLLNGMNGKFEDVFERGMVDAEGNRVTEGGIEWLLEPLDTTTEEGLRRETELTISFMIAKRTLELSGRFGRDDGLTGIGAGVRTDVEVANEILEDISQDPDLEQRVGEAADRYKEWADLTLRYMVDKGRISQEQYQAILENNTEYVALRRVMEIEPGMQVSDSKGNVGGHLGSVNNEVIQRVRGSSRTIENPYSTLLDATQNAIREADRNEVLQAFTSLLTQTRRMYQGDPNEVGTVGRRVNSDTDNAQVVFVDGRREHWQFDKDIHETLKGLQEIQGLTGFWGALFKLPATVLRFGVTRVPAFAIRNLIRDVQHRLSVTRSGNRRSLQATLDFRGNMDRENLQRYGGDHAGHYARDKIDWARALDSAISELAQDSNNIILDPRRLGRAYDQALQSGERFNRIAEFNAARDFAREELGYSERDANLHAAQQARELIDFAVAGRFVFALNQVIPFANAAVQGLRRNVTAGREDPAGFAIRWGLYALIPTMMAKAIAEAGGYQEELEEMPDYLRDMFWNFKLGPDKWLRIPRNFELGVLASGADRAIDVMLGRREAEDAFHGYGGSLARAMVPVDESAVFGPYQGMAQALANYEVFRERNIVPPHQEGVDLDARNARGERIRQSERASRFGQAAQLLTEELGLAGTTFGRKLGDARKVDFLVKSVLGSTGDLALRATNTGRDDGSRKIGLRDVGLFTGTPAYSSDSVQRVYNLAERAGLATNSRAFGAFNAAGDAYFEAKTAEEKDAAAKKWRSIAKEMIPHLEEMRQARTTRPE